MPLVRCTAAMCKFNQEGICNSEAISLENKEFEDGSIDEQVCVTFR